MYRQKPNSGALFPNREKRDAKDRDFSGSANIEGVEYWVSGYKNESKDGARFIGLSFKAKDAPRRNRPVQEHDLHPDEDNEDWMD